MSNPPEDFTWVEYDQPHRPRRREMLAKYPQIANLYGYDPMSKYKVILSFFLQLFGCYVVQDASWPFLIFWAYVWGGTLNHSLTLAIHEVSHNLFFPEPWQNLWFGIFTSLPLSVPISIGFKKYHAVHHSHLGVHGADPDLPTFLEGKYIRGFFPKFFFLFFQGFFYVLRPVLTQPMPLTNMEIVAYVVQAIYDISILQLFGWKALCYLFIGTALGCGIHPLAAHFVGEHYMWRKPYETYSYYGPINHIVYFVGFHNEHHDFPRIPGSKLHELHKIAPEYYEKIGVHENWVGIMWNFLFDTSVSPFMRIERKDSVLKKENNVL